MEFRCPDCLSLEVNEAKAEQGETSCRCGNCRAEFARDSALVAVGDLSCPCQTGGSAPPFSLEAERAAAELRDPDGAIETITPFSDADELNALLVFGVTDGILRHSSEVGRLSVHPMSIADPKPLLGVDLGRGLTLLGSAVNLRQRPEEDPITYTVRFLEQVAEAANALGAKTCGDARRLDRITDYMNANRPWEAAEVCEFVHDELLASGRKIRTFD